MAVTTIGAIALGASAISTGMSLSAGKKAKKAQQRANEAQMKANRLKNLQQKRTFLRGFRQAQANVLSTSIASGIGLGSSRTQGTLASEKSQAGLAVREFQQFDQLGVETANAQQQSASQAFRSQAFGAVASFSSQFISFGGGESGGKPSFSEQALGGN
jgi:hypothetical protein